MEPEFSQPETSDSNATKAENSRSTADIDSIDRTSAAGAESGSSIPIFKSPSQIDEFAVLQVLGRGGFGTVYLAFDSTLQREVALKIPHSSLVKDSGVAAEYLREARATASLDHPNIIPVYRASSTPTIPCYIVTKRIRGCHLDQWRASTNPSFSDIARMFAKIADALAYAHSQRLIHRDVKPGNILVDDKGNPYVADFGLAMREVEVNDRPTYVGTPSFMSPEQARGEGHRVDGRSDIFSFGTMLYECLTRKRPFTGEDRHSLMQNIQFLDPVDPCTVCPEVPAELARICMKALSKSVVQRYQSADLIAYELNAFAAPSTNLESGELVDSRGLSIKARIQSPLTETPRRIVPKGLRPFERQDSDFFLQLLPGPYDRDGLPEVVRFWLSRLSNSDDNSPLTVSLIYGPSGCGKTSLVRAGLIPLLPKATTSIYLQASGESTEAELCKQLLNRVPALANCPIEDRTDIVQLLKHLRRLGQGRTVIFIDQFEQWLFAHPESQKEPLTQALRHCDGQHLQCVLMVRDDFWMGITRMMNYLDIAIAENVNVRAVDLFDTRHARHVLSLFGTAYGRLPQQRDQWTPGQTRFVDAAVNYLAVDGRVICVQLALLADMMKSRTWEDEVDFFGGEGTSIGTQFLDETFDSENSSRRIRMHTDGAIRVLRAILPEAGSRIKGAVLSLEELYNVSGYKDIASFQQLLSILDRELHLITLSDRSGLNDESSHSHSDSTAPGYQLTHDFLIAPIYQWIEYHNRSSNVGMAKLRLDEFSALFQARPRHQSLPSLTEYLNIRRHIHPREFTDSQRRMMTEAKRRHLHRFLFSLSVISLMVAGGLVVRNAWKTHTENLFNLAAVDQLFHAEFTEAIQMANKLRDNPFARKQAELVLADTGDPVQQVRAALLVHDMSPRAAEIILEHALKCPLGEFVELVDAYQMPLPAFSEQVREIWNLQTESPGTLLRAACLLADNTEFELDLQRHKNRLSQLLLAENPVWINHWANGFRSSKSLLVPQLLQLLKSESRTTDSLNAINLIAAFEAEDPRLLVSLIPHVRIAELLPLVQAIKNFTDTSVNRWILEEVGKARDRSVPVVDPSRPWGSPWWCVGQRKPVSIKCTDPLPTKLRERLLIAESAIGEHAILSHQVSKAELSSLNQELGEFSYRIADLIPLPGDNQFLIVLWIRDGAESRYVEHASKDELLQLHHQHRQGGFLADNISLFMDDGQIAYSAVWIKPPSDSSLLDADIYVDIHQDVHQIEGWEPLSRLGLGLPRSNRFMNKLDGFDYFTSVRWRVENDIRYQDAWNDSDETVSQITDLNRSAASVSSRHIVDATPEVDSGITSVWWFNLPVESRQTESFSRRDHLREAQSMMEQAYYPVSIDVDFHHSDRGLRFCSGWWRGLPAAEIQVQRGSQLRNLAFVLMMLGDADLLADLLAAKHGEEARGATLSAFSELQVPVGWLLERLQEHPVPNVRRACACALTLYPRKGISSALRESVRLVCTEIMNTENEPGLRSSLIAIANAWKFDLETVRDNPSREIRSVVGDRLVIIRPEKKIWIGSTATEPGRDGGKEPLTCSQLSHDFAIATHEVTIEQFLKFRPGHKYPSGYNDSVQSPVYNVNLFDAMAYCRWLSDREELPESEMCYPPIDDIKPSMLLPKNFIGRSGYRLPMEVEWEYACRGGATKGRWFGFDLNCLVNHAYTAQNSNFRLNRVGQLHPNDYGLFDMLGNAMEWTQSRYQSYPQLPKEAYRDIAEDDQQIIQPTDKFATRGGAMLYQPLDARASQRNSHPAQEARVYLSFRVARTVPKVKE